ncbi:metal ABC transporter permease [Okeania sp. SIO1I7]|uniref:metal ABC transporter permease n=1 Tax=Okeania sp. SIO1I7 TaxID=2607772 RepID=UPI0013F6CF07|nr:metal ABC transporter permease [Okeania sp. SIO1I7]NET24215.1 metal ABC transporter permease [Okeania sp. SIO1I7]
MDFSEWINLFSLPFMQRAIIGGILLGILGGIIGGFVILRQLSLFGESLGHTAFLAVVLAVLLQLPLTIALIIFLVCFGLGINYLIEKTNLGGDTILSIVIASSVALGTIGFNFVPGYRGNLLSILFGDILAISNLDLLFLVILLIVTLVWLGLTLQQQILLTLNSDLAQIQGIPVERYKYIFIIILSLAIALTMRAVGILLVNAFLVIPAATAKLICHQFVPFLGVSATIGAISGVLGMIVSGSFNLPSGPSIVLVQLVTFLIVVFSGRGKF